MSNTNSEREQLLLNKGIAVKQPFTFIDPGILIDDDLELILIEKAPADPVKRWVPQYFFEMRHPGDTIAMGSIRLRIGSAIKLRYAGHIGYEVKKAFRGHRYAARSCRLLFPLAYAHGLRAIWLTVDPHNIPSQKTCRIIGAKYIETVRLPKDHEMYRKESPYRRRYRVDLRTIV
jgi:predicted acetyltransferase